MLRLASAQVQELLDQPETGMGYQIVQVDLRNTLAPRQGTVLNSGLLLWEAEIPPLRPGRFESLLAKASAAEARDIRSLRVIPHPTRVAEYVAERSATDERGRPAADGEPEATEEGEVFARFTAYRNDRRITPGKGLLPGSYATTQEDAMNVKTGSEAVERYALPDPTPAVFRFKIEPRAGTELRRGVVQPAFGHDGGGVEVLFDDGTHDGTVSGPKEIPP